MERLTRLWWKVSSTFTLPSSEELARLELEEAKRSHLTALTSQDYARQMVEYHGSRIRRLTAYLAKSDTPRTE